MTWSRNPRVIERQSGRTEATQGKLALDEGFVEGCLERMGEDETRREMVVESLKADCEVRPGRPAG